MNDQPFPYPPQPPGCRRRPLAVLILLPIIVAAWIVRRWIEAS